MRREIQLLALGAAILMAGPAAAENFFRGDAREAAFADVGRLAGIQARHEGELLARDGVFGVGITLDRERGRLALLVLVDNDAKMPQLPASLDGVPVVVERDTAPVGANGGSACQPCHANQLALPVQMGNSGKTTATCSSCTMGFKACDLQTGNTVWVTAAHCATNSGGCPGSAAIGANTTHVSPSDTTSCNMVGTQSVGTVAGHAPPVCGVNSTTDATSVNSTSSLTQLSIRDIGVPSAFEGTALVGDEVQKSGRTTGYTTGVVDAINVTVNVSYSCCTVTMIQQIRIDDTTGDIFCTGGDSGSGLLNMEDPPEVVGLIIARNTDGTTCWANTAANVLGNLGLSMNHLDCIDDPCPANAAADGTNEPLRAKDLLYQLRDSVFGQSERGKAYIRLFYDNAFAWAWLYARNPELLDRTQDALEANLDVLDALANGRRIAVPASRIKSLDRLLRAHQRRAQGELRAAFQAYRADLNNREVQAQFGIQVR